MIIGGLIGHILWDQEAGAPAAAAPPPEAPPETAEMPVLPPPAEHKVVLHSVRFDFNKAVIRADDVPVLDEVVRALLERPHVPVSVEGHTDTVGSRDYNLFLGRRRAIAVRDYLVDHGIAAERPSIRTLDADEPVASNETEEGRAQNRRVELKLQGGN
jgi:OOP family OmpA-OmpF porin